MRDLFCSVLLVPTTVVVAQVSLGLRDKKEFEEDLEAAKDGAHSPRGKKKRGGDRGKGKAAAEPEPRSASAITAIRRNSGARTTGRW